MAHRTAGVGFRVLVCAPFGRDASSVVDLLAKEGYAAEAVQDLADAAARLGEDDIGALLLTEEALMSNTAALTAALDGQARWSDVPIVLLAAPRSNAASWPKETVRLHLPDSATNVVVLERPLGVISLVSAVASALKARQKQFEIRDHLEEQRRAAAALDAQVKERTCELQRALERLQTEVAERARAEDQLRQAQKMEAVGQLTGGIAHDFNNMLTGVMGSLDIIRRRIASQRLDDIDRFMDAATASAQRAANLTQRLLAFSRRQSLDPQPIDANALVRSLAELLKRTIGETIALDLDLADDLPLLVADANQLENAIINLAINARDAMPDGGALTVATRTAQRSLSDDDAEPAGFVTIAISDTGVGMDEATSKQVFDPFFTTKSIGQGTGLGLSMVYGFANQSGGKVELRSAPGEGTSVVIYLPEGAAADVVSPAPIREKDASFQGSGETVLVVEDEAAVRQLMREILQELGYETIEAADGREAIPILSSRRRLDLMISDVGLPGMNGRQLAEHARSLRPTLPILFVTGYAERAASRKEFLGENMSMVTKPFTLAIVAQKVHEMLSGAARRAG
ncbi:MAG: hybrid sensor histidine kinase/response regulator [Ancylobacter novellus]|uniref:histidine kinase n=1 Tax=Ancylobacter novellus TaxID=921 RepID=A0A2W5K488_ANCNO|nr:MAG: hybrid sensor histidine kinase/response regulator [Ancylobacter novellus]